VPIYGKETRMKYLLAWRISQQGDAQLSLNSSQQRRWRNHVAPKGWITGAFNGFNAIIRVHHVQIG